MPDEPLKEQGETPETAHDVVDTASSTNDTAAELERTRAALKAANKEAAERRKKLEAYEKAEQERADKELSETEKLKKELERLRAEAESAQAKTRRYELERAIAREASKLNLTFHDGALEDALSLGVFADVDEAANNIPAVLKQVASSKSYLFKSADKDQKAGDINASNRGRNVSRQDIVNQEMERLRSSGRY